MQLFFAITFLLGIFANLFTGNKISDFSCFDEITSFCQSLDRKDMSLIEVLSQLEKIKNEAIFVNGEQFFFDDVFLFAAGDLIYCRGDDQQIISMDYRLENPVQIVKESSTSIDMFLQGKFQKKPIFLKLKSLKDDCSMALNLVSGEIFKDLTPFTLKKAKIFAEIDFGDSPSFSVFMQKISIFIDQVVKIDNGECLGRFKIIKPDLIEHDASFCIPGNAINGGCIFLTNDGNVYVGDDEESSNISDSLLDLKYLYSGRICIKDSNLIHGIFFIVKKVFDDGGLSSGYYYYNVVKDEIWHQDRFSWYMNFNRSVNAIEDFIQENQDNPDSDVRLTRVESKIVNFFAIFFGIGSALVAQAGFCGLHKLKNKFF